MVRKSAKKVKGNSGKVKSHLKKETRKLVRGGLLAGEELEFKKNSKHYDRKIEDLRNGGTESLSSGLNKEVRELEIKDEKCDEKNKKKCKKKKGKSIIGKLAKKRLKKKLKEMQRKKIKEGQKNKLKRRIGRPKKHSVTKSKLDKKKKRKKGRYHGKLHPEDIPESKRPKPNKNTPKPLPAAKPPPLKKPPLPLKKTPPPLKKPPLPPKKPPLPLKKPPPPIISKPPMPKPYIPKFLPIGHKVKMLFKHVATSKLKKIKNKIVTKDPSYLTA